MREPFPLSPFAGIKAHSFYDVDFYSPLLAITMHPKKTRNEPSNSSASLRLKTLEYGANERGKKRGLEWK